MNKIKIETDQRFHQTLTGLYTGMSTTQHGKRFSMDESHENFSKKKLDANNPLLLPILSPVK